MVRTESPICDFNLPAIEFELKGVDGGGDYVDRSQVKLNYAFTADGGE